MELDVLEAELIPRLHRDGYFLDRAGAVVAPRPRDGDVGRVGLARLDEEIFRQPDGLTLIKGGDVIEIVFLNLDRRLVGKGVVRAGLGAGQTNLLALAEREQPVVERTIGGDFEFRLRPFHGAQIAAALFHRILQLGPRREVVRDFDLFNRRLVDDTNREVARLERARLDVILDVFRQGGEDEVIDRGVGLRLHHDLFPLR